MTLSGQAQKWAVGVLALVCAALIVNLVSQFRSTRAESRRPAARRATASSPGAPRRGAVSAVDELARYDPVVHLAELKKYDARSLPDLKRNPFEFVEAPVAPAKTQEAGGPTKASAPAAPPPPPFKAMGYSESPAGTKQAYISDNEQNVYVVEAGDSFAQKYKVVTITSTTVTIEDTNTHQSIELPIPQ
jgi:hypothetical protein